jgi:CheY-like chemotaxis protein
VRLEVSDTGIAMSEEVRQRVFEPFFTTKQPGKGTGLGLATCYGIVTQTGGTIDVSSEPGRGTSFRIDLPYVEAELAAPVRPAARVAGPGTGETVLLVEDEPAVRRIASLALRARGYRVIEAADGEEALRIAQETGDEIDVLLSDVVMPRLGGRELAERLRRERPELRVLFMSGYTDDMGLVHDVASTGLAFLQKPFAPDALCRKVREVLDEKRVAAAAR